MALESENATETRIYYVIVCVPVYDLLYSLMVQSSSVAHQLDSTFNRSFTRDNLAIFSEKNMLPNLVLGELKSN